MDATSAGEKQAERRAEATNRARKFFSWVSLGECFCASTGLLCAALRASVISFSLFGRKLVLSPTAQHRTAPRAIKRRLWDRGVFGAGTDLVAIEVGKKAGYCAFGPPP